MFVQELLRILRERSEIITNWLVATMNCRIEHRILYINPELLTISRMVIDVCIVGDTKRIWIAFESSLCVRSVRYTNAEIAHWFRHSTAIARCTKRQYNRYAQKGLRLIYLENVGLGHQVLWQQNRAPIRELEGLKI